MCICLCVLGYFIMTVRKILPFKISNPLIICNQIWDFIKIKFEIEKYIRWDIRYLNPQKLI
jgi:hypothetical protein